MTQLERHVEDEKGISKQVPPAVQRRSQRGRSRTAGESDFDDQNRSGNQGHGHPQEERRASRGEA